MMATHLYPDTVRTTEPSYAIRDAQEVDYQTKHRPLRIPLVSKEISALLPGITTDSTTAGTALPYQLPNEEPTHVIPLDMDMLRLNRAVSLNDLDGFSQLVSTIHWEFRSEDDLINAIKLALSIGAHLTARQLASDAARRFPTHPEIVKYSKVLAPPKTLDTDLPPYPQASLNQQWLRENRQNYQGHWVAIKDGALLASEKNLSDLLKLIGEVKNTNILITKV